MLEQEDDRDGGQGRTAEGKLPHVSWERIIDHIDHAVKLVGADHVGLGSDFDGANMPEGMEDCTHLPQITEALMRKGYSDDDIRKILGGNLLRVMEANRTREPTRCGPRNNENETEEVSKTRLRAGAWLLAGMVLAGAMAATGTEFQNVRSGCIFLLL